MNLTAPTKNIFLISAILFVLGVLGLYVAIPFVTGHAFWFVTGGYVVLAAGVLMKGL
jgi:hypothetical protein